MIFFLSGDVYLLAVVKAKIETSYNSIFCLFIYSFTLPFHLSSIFKKKKIIIKRPKICRLPPESRLSSGIDFVKVASHHLCRIHSFKALFFFIGNKNENAVRKSTF